MFYIILLSKLSSLDICSKLCPANQTNYRALPAIFPLAATEFPQLPIGRDEEYVKLFAEEFMGSLSSCHPVMRAQWLLPFCSQRLDMDSGTTEQKYLKGCY